MSLSRFFLLCSAACSAVTSHPLPESSWQRLQEVAADPDALGESVYEGRVQMRGDDADALFRYERRVLATDGGFVASHLTLDPEGEPVLLHVSTYDESYTLQSFEEIHGQTGLVGRATVSGEDLELSVTLDGDTRQRRALASPPVHTGPSLFGFALQHWDDLLAGEALPLRFLVLHDERSYRFALRLESTDADTTVFGMTATSPWVRLAVAPMRITFDTVSRAPVRFEGLVPPMVEEAGGLYDLDARVDYTLAPGGYR